MLDRLPRQDFIFRRFQELDAARAVLQWTATAPAATQHAYERDCFTIPRRWHLR